MSSRTSISGRAFGFLLHLAEQERPTVTAHILNKELGAEAASLIGDRVLLPGKPLTTIDVALAEGDTQSPVDFDHATGVSSYFHPEIGFVDVAAEQLRTWKLDLPKLAALIGRMVGLPVSRKPMPLVDSLLWDLGTPRLGRRTGIPILFARRLGMSDVRAALRPEFELRLGKKPSVLLTTARSIPGDLSLPGISRIVPMETILRRNTAAAELDVERLAALADPRPGLGGLTASPVQCTEDGSWLCIRGREYNFRGKKKQLIRLLYEARARGEEWVGEKWVLAQADYDSKRIEDVFKDRRHGKRDQWREFIDVIDGKCRLRVDEEQPGVHC